MIDRTLLLQVIDSALSHRNALYNQLCEMNAYTEAEANDYIQRTKRIEELKRQIEAEDFKCICCNDSTVDALRQVKQKSEY